MNYRELCDFVDIALKTLSYCCNLSSVKNLKEIHINLSLGVVFFSCFFLIANPHPHPFSRGNSYLMDPVHYQMLWGKGGGRSNRCHLRDFYSPLLRGHIFPEKNCILSWSFRTPPPPPPPLTGDKIFFTHFFFFFFFYL